MGVRQVGGREAGRQEEGKRSDRIVLCISSLRACEPGSLRACEPGSLAVREGHGRLMERKWKRYSLLPTRLV